jgi:Zn-dependent M28 family amino/carboxypeptidase
MANKSLSFYAIILLIWSFDVLSKDNNHYTDKIDINEWYKNVEYLASFNRYYKSKDIIIVRDWLKKEFEKLNFKTTIQEFNIKNTKGYNLIAEIKGTTTPNEIFIVGAHYDSISENPALSAPGAEDDASGTAALISMAKTLLNNPPLKTIRFIAFSGEEMGLLGSEYYVKNILINNEKEKIKGAIIMDMIGFDKDNDLDCLIETNKSSEAMVNILQQMAKKYTKLTISTTYNYWGSDHEPFLNNNIPAALTIENDYEDYIDYHKTSDLPKNMSKEMALGIIKMNLATMWHYIG